MSFKGSHDLSKSKSKSRTKMLTPEQRTEYFNTALSLIAPYYQQPSQPQGGLRAGSGNQLRGGGGGFWGDTVDQMASRSDGFQPPSAREGGVNSLANTPSMANNPKSGIEAAQSRERQLPDGVTRQTTDINGNITNHYNAPIDPNTGQVDWENGVWTLPAGSGPQTSQGGGEDSGPAGPDPSQPSGLQAFQMPSYQSPEYQGAGFQRARNVWADPDAFSRVQATDPGSAARGMDRAEVQAALNGNGGTNAKGSAAHAGNAYAKSLMNGDYGRLEQAILQSILSPLNKYATEQRENVDEDLAQRGIYSSGLAVEAQDDLAGELANAYTQAGSQAVQQRYGLQTKDYDRAADVSKTNATNQTNASVATARNMTDASISNNNNELARFQATLNLAGSDAQSANQFNLGRADLLTGVSRDNATASNTWNMRNFDNLQNTINTNSAAFNAWQAAERDAANNFNLTNAQNQYNSDWAPANYLADLWNQTQGSQSSSDSHSWSHGGSFGMGMKGAQ